MCCAAGVWNGRLCSWRGRSLAAWFRNRTTTPCAFDLKPALVRLHLDMRWRELKRASSRKVACAFSERGCRETAERTEAESYGRILYRLRLAWFRFRAGRGCA